AERVALPLVAAISQLLEDMGREQILRLGRARRPLHRRRIHDIADLDDAIRRIDAQEGLVTDRPPRGAVDRREEKRIGGASLGLDVGAKFVEARVWPVEQIGPYGFPRRV